MLHLGTTDTAIDEAESKLGVRFPETLRQFYRLSNGIEIPPDWQVYAVFDTENPRKSAIHIVYENTVGRWSDMAGDLICLAGNGTGNQLVLRKNGTVLGEQIYVWNHETNKVKPWTKDLPFLVSSAKKRVEKIEKQIKRNQRRSA